MNSQLAFEKCLTFINSQLHPAERSWRQADEIIHPCAVTISRQSGSGGHVVAERLLEYLQARAPLQTPPWTIFDRNVVEKVLEDHHLPKHLAKFMPEDRISEIGDTMDELFGLHPPSWTLVRQSADTILHLAELGNVILIGRAANVITRKLKHAVHVRLVGSLERRAQYMCQLEHLSLKAALDFIRREDRGRRRYLKKYFNKDIDDPLLYHLVINTDLVPYQEAASLIANAVIRRMAPASAEASPVARSGQANQIPLAG